MSISGSTIRYTKRSYVKEDKKRASIYRASLNIKKSISDLSESTVIELKQNPFKKADTGMQWSNNHLNFP
jgi:hypothetical protein